MLPPTSAITAIEPLQRTERGGLEEDIGQYNTELRSRRPMMAPTTPQTKRRPMTRLYLFHRNSDG